MIDPRIIGLQDRLAGVRRIIAVTGGKGGIGKSMVSSTLALALAETQSTGLLDLDLTSPTDHLILGAPVGFPEEPFGITPPAHAGVAFMSIAHFSGSTPAPLRGKLLTDALLEMLAITNWGELDSLVIDMPPGLSDIMLDLVQLLHRAEYLVVSTPSIIVRETVRRTLTLLRELDLITLGVVENMRREPESDVAQLAADFDLPLLGELPHDPGLEAALGNPDKIRGTKMFAAMREVAVKI